MAKSPNAEDCSSNQAIFLELKKQGEEVGMGQQRAIRELSQSLAALPEALCIGKKKKKDLCWWMAVLKGKKKKQNSTFRTKTKSTNIQKDIPWSS